MIALKELMTSGLKLGSHTRFFSSGTTIANAIKTLYEEKSENQVAIVIIDFNMPGMNGLELMTWTRGYFKTHNLPDPPKFAFRAQPFY